MKTTILEKDGNITAILEGRLDTATAPETEKAMKPIYDSEGKDIILDCAGLEYISSAGLRIFLCMLQKAQGKGQEGYIKDMTDDVRAVFAMTGFSNIFKFK